LFNCFDRPTPRAFSGTFFVIVEPAAMVELLPISTGATNEELLPIKLLSPTIVLCLLVPS
jgi:hypothetical protein